VDALCSHYNEIRLEALAQHLFLEEAERRYLLHNLLTTLREFFGFVDAVNRGGYFLNENIALVRRYFKSIMHKFIFKFADVDSRMIEGIYTSLSAYYGFLAQKGTVPTQEFQQFQEETLKIKQELLAKRQKYNAVRRDSSMSETSKAAIRDEICEGDHLWPSL
jgi:hypothetical protein